MATLGRSIYSDLYSQFNCFGSATGADLGYKQMESNTIGSASTGVAGNFSMVQFV